MADFKKPKKNQKSAYKQRFERVLGVTDKIKNNKAYRFVSYISRKLFWFLLILTILYWGIVFYGDNTEIGADDNAKLDGYEALLVVLEPATPLIEERRALILTEIVQAKSDGKVTVSEFVEIESMYKDLEDTLMDLVVMSLANKKTDDSANQDKGE